MNVQTTIEQGVPERLARMRAVMARKGVDALLVPSADPHLSEYMPGYWQGRRWLSGFDGSVGMLVVTAVFLGIGNSVRLGFVSRRDTINVMKLIGASDGFILRPFLNGGAMLGFTGALLSLILSEVLVLRLESVVTQVAQVFGTTFDLHGLGWDESLLLLIVSAMIGWIAAWLATAQHLRRFTPQ